jgi:hypothetical protein
MTKMTKFKMLQTWYDQAWSSPSDCKLPIAHHQSPHPHSPIQQIFNLGTSSGVFQSRGDPMFQSRGDPMFQSRGDPMFQSRGDPMFQSRGDQLYF